MVEDDGPRRTAIRAIGRAAGIPLDDSDLRRDLLDTMMLRPVGVLTASLCMMLMSAAALWMTRAPWAGAWLLLDIVVSAVRLAAAIQATRSGRRVGERTAYVILATAWIMFTVFGIGCAVSFKTGIEPLRIAATLGILGLVTGIGPRWAAFPRLGVGLAVSASLPMLVAIAGLNGFVASFFALLVVHAASLTLQNHRLLMTTIGAERAARILAETDPLTGLLNRTGLISALDALPRIDVAILFLDLDGFKSVNDRHGHAAGDAVLTAIGARLRQAAPGQIVARLGGDEFVVVLTGDAADMADTVAAVAGERVAKPIPLEELCLSVRVGISAGIARGALGSGADALLAEADAALYEVKRHKAMHTSRRHVAAA